LAEYKCAQNKYTGINNERSVLFAGQATEQVEQLLEMHDVCAVKN